MGKSVILYLELMVELRKPPFTLLCCFATILGSSFALHALGLFYPLANLLEYLYLEYFNMSSWHISSGNYFLIFIFFPPYSS